MIPLPRVRGALLAHWPNYIRRRRLCQSAEPSAGSVPQESANGSACFRRFLLQQVEMQIQTTRKLLTATYEAFNRRDIDSVLATMHTDVNWANGIDGGRLRGHDEVREYWKGLWTRTEISATPLMF